MKKINLIITALFLLLFSFTGRTQTTLYMEQFTESLNAITGASDEGNAYVWNTQMTTTSGNKNHGGYVEAGYLKFRDTNYAANHNLWTTAPITVFGYDKVIVSMVYNQTNHQGQNDNLSIQYRLKSGANPWGAWVYAPNFDHVLLPSLDIANTLISFPVTLPVGTTKLDLKLIVNNTENPEVFSIDYIKVAETKDITPPVAICQPVTLQLDATGNAVLTVAQVDNGSYDLGGSGIASMLIDQTAFTCANLGTNQVELTVIDGAGNINFCTSTVTVVDLIAPVFSNCPGNITVSNKLGDCSAPVTWNPILATDNCSATIAFSHNSGDVFPKGTTPVTVTATDPSGNTATCSFTVTVNDMENPVAVVPANLFVNCNTYMSADVPKRIPTGTGTTGTTVSLLVTSGGTITDLDVVSLTGTHTWTADLRFYLTSPAGTTVTLVQNQCGSADNFNLNFDESSSLTVPCPLTGGGNYKTQNTNGTSLNNFNGQNSVGIWTLTITDSAEGDIGQLNSWGLKICTGVVNTASIIPNNPGQCGANVAFPIAATDNCPGVKVTSDYASGYFFPVGSTPVTFTATDLAGNTSTGTFTITIADTELPSITCPANINTTTDPGVCQATLESIGTPIYNDNCGVASVLNNAPLGLIFPKGITTVTWIVTDIHGNSSQCQQTVTVVDDEDPTIGACGLTYIVEMKQVTSGTTTVWRGNLPQAKIKNLIHDNCDIIGGNLNVVFSQTIFTPQSWGTNTVTVTATDAAGNDVSCTITVIVRYPLKAGEIGPKADNDEDFANVANTAVTVYPNPTRGKLTIQMAGLNNPNVTAVVYNMAGSVVMRKNFSTEGQFEVDLTGMVNGMYMLKVTGDGVETVNKIVLKDR